MRKSCKTQYIRSVVSVVTVVRSFSVIVLMSFICTANAEGEKLINVRRTIGIALIGIGGAFSLRGLDYSKEADNLSSRSKRESDTVEIDRLNMRRTNQNIKAQACWAFGVAYGVSGLRLLITQDGPKSEANKIFGQGKGNDLRLSSDRKWIQMQLQPLLGHVGFQMRFMLTKL